MAELSEPIWKYNFARVVVIDVSDDYRLMQPPLPSDLYPVLQEFWLPKHNLRNSLPGANLVEGYLYDWHESPGPDGGEWFVGVVDVELVHRLLGESTLASA